MSEKSYEVCPLSDLEIGVAQKFVIVEHALAVIRVSDNEVRIIADRCSHADYSLAEGEFDAEEFTLECWKHGSTFSLVSGEPQCFPATQPVTVYKASIENSVVKVSIND